MNLNTPIPDAELEKLNGKLHHTGLKILSTPVHYLTLVPSREPRYRCLAVLPSGELAVIEIRIYWETYDKR